jgi:abequosyltransferase
MLLSICIPTYNRSNYIDQLLASIAKDPYASQVAICISDNASQDNTVEIVHKWIDYGLQITFKRATENRGPDQNYLMVASLAKTPFIWFMGSDDLIIPYRIQDILKMIETFSYCSCFLFTRVNRDLNLKYQGIQEFVKIKQTDPEIFNFYHKKERHQYFKKAYNIGAYFSYLSAIIVKRDSWNSVSCEEKYIGTGYSHTSVILKFLGNKESSQLCISRLPIVDCRLGNDSFFENFHQRLMLDLNGYKMLAHDYIQSSEQGLFFKPFKTDDYAHTVINALRFNRNSFKMFDFFLIFQLIGISPILKRCICLSYTKIKKLFFRKN